jgi:hypothetical protein
MIDWAGKLECDAGRVCIEATSEERIRVSLSTTSYDHVGYWVDKEAGKPANKHLPASFTVRNQKSVEEKALQIAWTALSVPNALNHEARGRDVIDALKEANLLREDK